jgi:hypothetical protein
MSRSTPTPTLALEADLSFSVAVPGGREVTGRLTGSGVDLELRVSDPYVFAGRRDAGSVRGLASALAERGVTVTVVAPSGPLVVLGARRTTWLQRRITRSRHIRVPRGAGLLSLARGRVQASGAPVLPTSDIAPAPTLWPPAPTFLRRRRTVTTTHDPSRGGNPRLIMASRPDPWPGDAQQVFPLGGRDVIVIGSDEDCDVRLGGLDGRHAVVHHDERDEFVLERLGMVGTTKVNGAPVTEALLRTGSRIQVGDWTLSFYREEYADHGRPFGGRIGGELGHQRPQPSREQIRRGAGPAPD